MTLFGPFDRRTITHSRAKGRTRGQLGRLIVLAALLTAVFLSALEPAAQASPAAFAPDPTERLQFIIKSVHIFDDRDGWARGSGELGMITILCSGPATDVCGYGDVSRWDRDFSADSGETVVMERLSPQNGDDMRGGVTEAGGFPVFAGRPYHLFTIMWESDVVRDDRMGEINVPIDANNAWGLGTYTVRSTHDDGSVGDYNITYEIRRMSLPDVEVHFVNEGDQLGVHFYCFGFTNVGEQLSPPVSVRFTADGTVVRSDTVESMDSSSQFSKCIQRTQLPPLQHTLRVTLDEEQAVMETHKANNTYQMTVPALQAPTPTVTPTPTPNPKGKGKDKDKSKVDFAIQSVHIDNQDPDGKNGCKDTVTVVVKNGGESAAESFLVRLTVDNAKGTSTDKTVASLDAGQEQAITFEGIHLDPGQRTLRAVADPDHAASESKEGNNEGKTSARCKSES